MPASIKVQDLSIGRVQQGIGGKQIYFVQNGGEQISISIGQVNGGGFGAIAQGLHSGLVGGKQTKMIECLVGGMRVGGWAGA